MSIETLKEEIARLSPEELRDLMAYAVKVKNDRSDPWIREIAEELKGDEGKETWIPVSEARASLMKHWAETP